MISIAPHVAAALENKQAVVALESTVISHGLPYPHNLEVALALEEEVRAAGAVPATIAVVSGVPTVGIDRAQLEHFAQAKDVLKLSRRDIAYAIAMKRDGATTVAATMALAAAAGIDVFATGGIGGVHRGASQSWDISADLTELSRTPVLVVCAGAKAILDLQATVEQLETLGVPVLGLATDELPAFYSKSPWRVEDPKQAAAVWLAARLESNAGPTGGMLLCVPPPSEVALPWDEVEQSIQRALARAEAANVRGQAVTPFLLAAMAEETHGESMETNIALLRQNARVAAQVAQEIAASK
jgi:pseudouridine-5'-phosphate glycosidase